MKLLRELVRAIEICSMEEEHIPDFIKGKDSGDLIEYFTLYPQFATKPRLAEFTLTTMVAFLHLRNY